MGRQSTQARPFGSSRACAAEGAPLRPTAARGSGSGAAPQHPGLQAAGCLRPLVDFCGGEYYAKLDTSQLTPTKHSSGTPVVFLVLTFLFYVIHSFTHSLMSQPVFYSIHVCGGHTMCRHCARTGVQRTHTNGPCPHQVRG